MQFIYLFLGVNSAWRSGKKLVFFRKNIPVLYASAFLEETEMHHAADWTHNKRMILNSCSNREWDDTRHQCELISLQKDTEIASISPKRNYKLVLKT